jgi:hypothetical protein
MAQHTIKLSKKEDTAQRAMLLQVTIHHWKGRRNDKRISNEVAERHGADANMGAYLKRLVTKERLERIGSLTSQIRDLWYERTLPWLDQGTRILPNSSYFATMGDLDKLIHQRDDAVLDLVHSWEEVVAEAKVRLNGLFNATDYPTPQSLRHAFRVKVTPLPFPSGGDFRLGALGSDAEQDEAALRAATNEAVQEALGEAMRDVFARVHEVTTKMVERLSTYQIVLEGDKESIKNPFRDSLVENVRDLVKLLPGLNVTGDPILAGLTDKMEKQLCRYDADELRDDAKLRKKTAQAAEKILAQVSDFLG